MKTDGGGSGAVTPTRWPHALRSLARRDLRLFFAGQAVSLAGMLGMTYAFEIPARQALLADLAGEDMPNAIALNSSIVNAARVAGPALAGVVVASVGEGWAFALNAASFVGTYYALLVMSPPSQPPAKVGHRAHVLEGLAYAGGTSHVRALLALLAASSFFAMPYQTLLPVLSSEVLGGDARLYGTLLACAGAGALAGAIGLLLRKGLAGLGRRVALGTSLLGAGIVGLALSRTVALSALALAVVGFGFITQMAGTMTLLQGLAPADMRGRVMGLFSMLFVGVSPFGALAAGFAASHLGAQRTLACGGVVVLAASLAFHVALPRLRRIVLAEHPTLFPPAAS